MRCGERLSSAGTRRSSHGASKLRRSPAFARCGPLWAVSAVRGERAASKRGGSIRGSQANGSSRVHCESVGYESMGCEFMDGWRFAARVVSPHGAGGSACVCPHIFVPDSHGHHTGLPCDAARTRELAGARECSSRPWSEPRASCCIKPKATNKDDGTGTLC
jgi:hypothetical protein